MTQLEKLRERTSEMISKEFPTLKGTPKEMLVNETVRLIVVKYFKEGG